MKVKYIGPHDGVEIPSLNITVARDGVIEVADHVAEALGDDFVEIKPGAPRKEK